MITGITAVATETS